MKDLVQDLFGRYVPITYEVEEYTTDGSIFYEVIPAGVAGVDWEWLAGVLLFAITLYSVYRIMGVSHSGR